MKGLSVQEAFKELNEKYYILNFKGFYDTEKSIFGRKVLDEDIENLTFSKEELSKLVKNQCEIISKLGYKLNYLNVIDYKEETDSGMFASLEIVGQNNYILNVNRKVFEDKDILSTIIYHELCHLYQLERLFEDKIIFWDYNVNKLSTNGIHRQEAIDNLEKDNGHTKYWRELTDLLNSKLNLKYKITEYVDELIYKKIFMEELNEEYYRLNIKEFKF